MKNADNPAMPLSGDAYQDFAHYDGTPKTGYNPECQGLTKREMFAMEAMKAAISNKAVFEYGNFKDSNFKVELKKFSYEMADFMLDEELEK